ncbi:MAG: hypothetical protein P1V81_02225 [Planctomycetota bacterium]|nr:hypothetical protein [Planctomycetota bacterium]
MAGTLALFERFGRRHPRGAPARDHRAANGDAHADTFMARDLDTADDLRLGVDRAVARARAGLEALRELRLPGQRTDVCLQRNKGWCDLVPLSGQELDRVAFVTARGVFLADVPAGREEAVARELMALLGDGEQPDSRLVPLEEESRSPTRCALAIGVGEASLTDARHLHRRAWTRSGGPWLGVVEASGLELVTTCHRAIDGFGHALLADAIFQRGAEQSPSSQPGPSPSGCDRAPLPPIPAGPASPTTFGFATRQLQYGGRFAQQLVALARVLPGPFGSSATIQVPVVPSSPAHDLVRSAPVLHALIGLDPLSDPTGLDERLKAWLEDARQGAGVLTRLTAVIARAPVPAWLRRHWLRTHRAPHPWIPMTSVLAGRARLSSLRFPHGQRPLAPLYAASAPGLLPSRWDPRGAFVLTLVHHERGATASLFGTGLAGNDEAAQALLDDWLQAFEAYRCEPPQELEPTPSPIA